MIYSLDGIAPDVAADAWVAPGAHVIGRVTLGAGASVWFGAALRGDNEPITIGASTNTSPSASAPTKAATSAAASRIRERVPVACSSASSRNMNWAGWRSINWVSAHWYSSTLRGGAPTVPWFR